MRFMRVYLALAAMTFLLAATCQTNAPTSDSTPPSLEWVVPQANGRPRRRPFATDVYLLTTSASFARRSVQYAFIRSASALEESLVCWTATWLFPTPFA